METLPEQRKGEKGEMELDGEEEREEWTFPFWIASRRRFKAGDLFFAAGNIERELLAKQVALDLTEDERYQFQNTIDADIFSVFCPIVGCRARLNCLEVFEDHYHARHAASCSVCSRVYPTSRLLSIHVSEAHDSFFQAKVARGFPMYECLVEGCEVKLKNYKSRKQHLVDKHRFPRSFEFFTRSRPSQHRRHRNQHRQAGSRRDESKDAYMDVDEKISKLMHQKYQPKLAGHREETKEMLMDIRDGMVDDLTSAVLKLSTSDSTPSSVSFGHRHARGFAFVPRSVRRNGRPTAPPDAKD